MFKVLYQSNVRIVCAVDRQTESFLVIDWWDKFEWIPIDECIFYDSEEE